MRLKLSNTISFVTQILVCHLLLEFLGSVCLVVAAINGNERGRGSDPRSPIGKHHPSHSDYVIKYSEGTPFSAELEYHYLLPEQTVFDSPEDPVASKVLLTSPPRLTIQPSHAQEYNYQDNSITNKKYGHHGPGGASVLVGHSQKPEACITETSTFPFVASSFSTEHRTGAQYTVTVGRTETALSTEAVNNLPGDAASKVSHPSVVLMHGATVSTKSLEEIQKR